MTESNKTGLTEEQAKQVVKKKRGGKTFSLDVVSSATNEEMKSAISSVLYWRGMPKVQSDEECAERLNEFFAHINETGEIPTVEKMCMALGTIRQRVWDWENGRGCSPERAEMIRKAKDVLAALDAELVSRGKIPQVTYIFRAKNFYNMADQTQVVVTPSNPLGDQTAPEQLEEYLNVIDAD